MFTTDGIGGRREDMNMLEITDDLKITSGKLKQRLMKLTIDDLTSIDREHEKLMTCIQERIGEPREAVENAFMDLFLCGA